MTLTCNSATRLRDAMRAWLGTHECANMLFCGRCSSVVLLFEALIELLLGTTKLCLTLILLLLLPLLHELRSHIPC